MLRPHRSNQDGIPALEVGVKIARNLIHRVL